MLSTSRRRTLLALAAFPILVLACGGSVSSSGDSAPGTDTGSTSDGTSGAHTGPDASASCGADTSQAKALIAASDPSSGCSVDTDCQYVEIGQQLACVDGCTSTFLGASRSAAFTSAIAQANSGACADYTASSCPNLSHSCPYRPGSQAPQCIAGSCVAGYEADWTSFSVQGGTAGDTWTVTPDRQITVKGAGLPTATTMSDADFAVIDGTLRDSSFRQQLVAFGYSSSGEPLIPCATGDAGGSPANGDPELATIEWPVSRAIEGAVPHCGDTPNALVTMTTLLEAYPKN